MGHEQLHYLLQQYRLGRLSPDERQELLKAFADTGNEQDLLSWISQEMESVEVPVPVSPEKANQVFATILQLERQTTTRPRTARMIFRRYWWAAASIAVMCIAGSYFLVANKAGKSTAYAKSASIQPGRNGAVLTLADGKLVDLDTIRNATVALQGGVTARVVNGGLIYEGTGQEVLYNTISTSKGREYHVILPDGSEVWLNAMSSIHYPTAFTGKERKIAITGEAYFEVAGNSEKPFCVQVNDRVKVEVLGTHFNINAYNNEKLINTTLLEGRVKVNNVMISPGQQAQVTNLPAASGVTVIQDADINKVIAWKNGFFNFDNVRLDDAMRQLERWYDIDVVYENDIPDIELEGKLSKGVTLNELMTVLEDLGVNAQLTGRKLSISQKKRY